MHRKHRRTPHITLIWLLTALLWTPSASVSADKPAEPRKLWTTEVVFQQPESVAYDAERGYMYVSNINGEPTERNEVGFIARLDLEGNVESLGWVTGLNAPKGLDIWGDRLYVADIDTLVEIDLDSGDIIGRYRDADAEFLNDVAVAPDGTVYVSDMMADAIYRLRDGSFERWLQTSELAGPNGLLVEEDSLIVGSWGLITEGFETEEPGHLKMVSRDDGAVRSLGDGRPVGNLDGVQPDGHGNYYVTDWISGKLYRIRPSGDFDVVLELEQGLADHVFVEDENLLLLPLMMSGRVVAYRVGD